MKRLFVLATICAVNLCAGAALAQEGGGDDKKITLGGDLQFVLPIGDMGDYEGPQIGALFHAGYRVIPALEITGRIGYLAGLSKSQGPVDISLSNIPIWVGARYFFMDAPAGLYAGAELALNLMTATASGGGLSASKGVTREGFNVGAGYVISRDLPIDIRAQLSMFNLLGKDTGEPTFMGIGISAGYSFFL